ncbi:MAG: PorT family protein [Chitinophagaceae bacterium]|nr:PorT family protein [Chitinophagaceae bacterium]
MKKIILFAAFAVVGFATQAQVKFGAKAGLNLSNLTGDVSDNKMKIGFNVGGLVNIPVSSQFSVQPELLFSSEGTKFDDGTTSQNFNLSYINIPVMLQYNNESGFYAEAGPQLGILASAKTADTDVKEFFNSTNFGLGLGLGYNMSNGLGFGARYSLGLGNIAKDSGSDKIKTSNISIGLHYTFGGAKSQD